MTSRGAGNSVHASFRSLHSACYHSPTWVFNHLNVFSSTAPAFSHSLHLLYFVFHRWHNLYFRRPRMSAVSCESFLNSSYSVFVFFHLHFLSYRSLCNPAYVLSSRLRAFVTCGVLTSRAPITFSSFLSILCLFSDCKERTLAWRAATLL